jgi:uncharacterized protein
MLPGKQLRLARRFALPLAMAATWVAAAVPVPELRARVTDLTSTLTGPQKAEIEERLRVFEAERGSQIAVLIVPSTGDEAIEQYALRVVESWRLGRSGVDDGALLLVAMDDRRIRIEVGYGLEGALNDATARRIISETIVPQFRSGDPFVAISMGVERMIAVAEGEPLPEPEPDWSSDTVSGVFQAVPILLALGFAGGAILRRLFGRFWGALVTAGLTGFLTWYWFPVLIVAAIVALTAFFLTFMSGPGGGGARWSSQPHRGGWSRVSGGGSWGGGGFSGGGGSFGGGGASGSW